MIQHGCEWEGMLGQLTAMPEAAAPTSPSLELGEVCFSRTRVRAWGQGVERGTEAVLARYFWLCALHQRALSSDYWTLEIV